ncbi:biopolymer transporter ExbD [Marivita sp. S0852]|uniref:biopolymer transporter ExbD n=1 Tax=Marivita sp. S0852 TaxID=3373893 RepID=UPI003981A134
MTSLIDVIFLLLLFFMLTSTFTRFAEVDLTSGSGGTAVADNAPIFAQLGPDAVRLNGTPVLLPDLATRLSELRRDKTEDTTPLLIALQPGVTAQRLTDVLVKLRDVSGVSVTILESS